MIDAHTKLCMVIGHPINHSLSPEIHNAGYKALGLDDEFVFVACDVKPESIKGFVTGIRTMGIRGVSCTVPHKEIILPHLDLLDPVAKKIGAVNTIVQEGGKLRGYNTDWIGAVAPLTTIAPLKGKKAAVIGAGGAARAIIYGLTHESAEVTVYNRTAAKAKALAQEFDCAVGSLDDQESLREADIICNATSVGMQPNHNEMPIESSALHSGQIVFDVVYASHETKLIKAAKVKGAQVVHGSEMLLWQAGAQFKLYTGHNPPEAVMRKALMKGLKS